MKNSKRPHLYVYKLCFSYVLSRETNWAEMWLWSKDILLLKFAFLNLRSNKDEISHQFPTTDTDIYLLTQQVRHSN